MKAIYTHRTTCRLCEGSDLSLVLPLRPTPIADQYVRADQLGTYQPLLPLDVTLCHRCGHVQLLDVVDPDLLFRDYTYQTAISLGLVEHSRQFANRMIVAEHLAPGALVVEIGSNDGSMLETFHEHGCRVLGVDPAKAIAAQATERGVETWAEFFTSATARRIRAEQGPANLMIANNVFAHSDALGDMAEGITHLLAEDGLFVFEVSYLVDILQDRLFDTVYHEHLSYHSVEPLRTFLQRHGLELLDIERTHIKGGGIRCFVRKADKHRNPSENVNHLLALEAEMGLRNPAPFLRLAESLEEARGALARQLDTLGSAAGPLAGYGASATVTTLLYHFSLEERLDILVDDNPAKHGTFSPGCHLPVYPSEHLYETPVETVVILAWQYAQPILNRHKAFLSRGGRLVVPMPTLEIL